MTENEAFVTSEKAIRAMSKALKDFGYSDLTDVEVRAAAEAIMRGEEPTDIIGMFLGARLSDARRVLRETEPQSK